MMNIKELTNKLNEVMNNATAHYDRGWKSITIECEGNQEYGESYMLDFNYEIEHEIKHLDEYISVYLMDVNSVALDTIRYSTRYIDIEELMYEIKAWKSDMELVLITLEKERES